jgi:hypothetical protein
MTTPKNPPPLPAHFTTEDMGEAFRHFLPKVEKISADEVPVRSADVQIARHNIERGVNAVLPRIAELPDLLPKISVKAILELPALALGLVYADGRVSKATAGEIDAALAKVSSLRELTLSYLEIAGALGLIPLGRAQTIRAGKGKLDNARDCVDIAGVFEEYAAVLAGKHPFTKEQLTELATTGTWLVKNISPKGAVKDPAQRDPAAAIRDRFWKALEDGHDDLRTVGVTLFGIKNVDASVPPLFSRSAAAATGKAAAADGGAGEKKAEEPGTGGGSPGPNPKP